MRFNFTTAKWKRRTFYFAFLVSLGSVVSSAAQAGDGYIGIFSDPSGLTPCVTVPQMTAATLYVLAITSGATGSGISGAEFRIEIANPEGWTFDYTAPPDADVVLGTPLDFDPNPDAGGGVNITLSPCQPPINGTVSLGTITVYNVSGTSTDLLVKQHSTPSNHMYACPLFTLCDGPQYTKLCVAPEEGCALQSKPEVAGDSGVFRAVINLPTPDDSPPTPLSETISVFGADIWVAGRHITGDQVALNFDGSRFFINEVEVPFRVEPRVIPDVDLQSAYGASPRFQELRATASIRDAVEQLEHELAVLIGDATIAYVQSGIEAARQVFMASTLVSEVAFENDAFWFSVPGLLGRRRIDLGSTPDPTARPMSHQQRVVKLINHIKQSLSRPYDGGVLFVISSGGGTLMATGTEGAKGRAQITHLLNGGTEASLPEGPLGGGLLRDFVAAGGGLR